MVLNEDGVPCLRIGEHEVVGVRRILIGTKKVKRGRGYSNIPEYFEEPKLRLHIHLVPATERGWKKEIKFEKPLKMRYGIEIRQYRLTSDMFRCSRCRTSKHILLYLVGWSYERYPTLKHHGSGVMWRCFKCDMTQGAVAEDKYGEVKVLKKDATEREAIKILKKYGLDGTEFGPIL